MNAQTKMLAKHRAIYERRQSLEDTEWLSSKRYTNQVSLSDRVLLQLAKAPCANDDEFFAKLAYIVEIELKDYGDPEGRDFESTVSAVRSYLEQRKAAAAA